MLIFVVPLQSPEVSKDWANVSRLAVRCLASLTAQDNEDYRVILVCNRRPDNFRSHVNVTVVEEAFPIPVRDQPRAGMEDKWRKVRRGLVEAGRFYPGYVMVVDADDCISCRLATHVNRAKPEPGWFCDTGYLYVDGSSWFMKRRQIYQICGSSSMVYCDRRFQSETEAAESPISRFGHSTVVPEMERRGTPLRRLPFPSVVYVTATGENHSGINLRSKAFLLKHLSNIRLLTKSRRREFGL